MKQRNKIVVICLSLALLLSLLYGDKIYAASEDKYPPIKHKKAMVIKEGKTKQLRLKVRADCKILTTTYKIVSGKDCLKRGKKKGSFKGIKEGIAKVKVRITYYIGMYTFKTYQGFVEVKVKGKKPVVTPTPIPTNEPIPTSTPTTIPSATSTPSVTGSAVDIIASTGSAIKLQ